MDWRMTGLVLTGSFMLATPAMAQDQSPPPPVVDGQVSVNAAAVTAPETPATPPRFGRDFEQSVGFRLWVWNTPAWMVGLFAHVEGNWSGPLTVTAGPEYVLRRRGMDIVIGLQYTSFATDPGYIRGNNDQPVAIEQVQSSLYAVYANALFLWRTRFNDWFELQYGVGIGLGYVGGDLYRDQVYPTGGSYPNNTGWGLCQGPGSPGILGPTGGQWCDNANNHFPINGARYTEPRLTSGGDVPNIIPWVSIPHIATHFRPHRNVDVRLDFGFGLIGFYGGLAAHFVFN